MFRRLCEMLFPRMQAKPAAPPHDLEDAEPVLLRFPAPKPWVPRLRLLDLHEECDELPPVLSARVGRALAAMRGAGFFGGEGEGI